MKRYGLFISAFLLFCIFTIIIFPCSLWLGKYRFDVTSDKIYTLLPISNNYAKNLKQKIYFKLYISDNLSDLNWNYRQYAKEVIGLLSRYSLISDGKINLAIYYTKPLSSNESQALKDGIIPLTDDKQNYYFGLSVTFEDNRQEIIPSFEPQRKYVLQSDINHILDLANNKQKPLIGIYSPNMPWFEQSDKIKNHKFIDFLSQSYNLINIPDNVAYIPSDIEVLLVNNPINFTATSGYAIDQYVMQGGKVIFFVDPYSENLHQFKGYPPRPDYEMENFLSHWGIGYHPEFIRADKVKGLKIKDEYGKYFIHPLWFYASGKNTDRLLLKTSGSLIPNNKRQLKYQNIIFAQNSGGYIRTNDIRYTAKSRFMDFYQPDEEIPLFGILVQGEFLSHYSQNIYKNLIYKNKVYPYNAYSKSQAAIVVIADSDFLSDDSWVLKSSLENPIYGTVAFSDNAEFILNLIDNLRGKIKLSTYITKHNSHNLAEFFYSEAYQKYADVYFKTETKIALLSSRFNQLKKQNERFNNLKSKEKLNNINEQLKITQKNLEHLNQSINFNVDKTLYFSILLNIIIFPCGIIIGIIVIAFILRRKNHYRIGEKI